MRLVFAAACVAAFPVFAQDADDLARQYVDLPANQKMMDSMFSPEAMADQMRAFIPANQGITEDQIQEIGFLMSTEMNRLRPRMEEAMTEVSAETFTPEELEAMIEFYSSDLGASVLGKMQIMMSAYMAQVGPDTIAAMQNIQPQMMEILQRN